MSLDAAALQNITKVLPLLSMREQEQLLAELDRLTELREQEQAQKKFVPFVKQIGKSIEKGERQND